jgi:5-formyltetrahydrofolate cyclo-ligase
LTTTDKRALRARLTAERRALPSEERIRCSRAIAQRVAALPAFARARTVALYAPMGAEVDTGELARLALEAGKTVVWPRLARLVPDMEGGTAKLAHRLEFAPSAASELVEGPLATRQPPPVAGPVEPASIDLVCVPGVGFDTALRRLGRGGGHYDATLPALPRAVRVGLAFDLQIVASLPVEPHDSAVELVATEARLLAPPAGPGRG